MRATYVVYMYMYDYAFRYSEMGYASAVGYIMAIIIFVLTVINMKVSGKFVLRVGGGAAMTNVKSIRPKRVLQKAGIHAILLAGAVIMVLPLFWMITTSLKEMWEVFTPKCSGFQKRLFGEIMRTRMYAPSAGTTSTLFSFLFRWWHCS